MKLHHLTRRKPHQREKQQQPPNGGAKQVGGHFPRRPDQRTQIIHTEDGV
jgi:hypothetical protein